MTTRLLQIAFDKGLATVVQSILAGSRHAPLDPLNIGLCVSGGPDSMALACLVASLKDRNLGFDINPVAFVIDHNARTEAGIETQTVSRLLSKLGIPCHIEKIEWDHPDPLQLSNFEGKAREHRYRLLTKLALDHGVRHLFLGHHRDDQLETVILRMIRNHSLSFMDLRGMESTAPVPVPYSIYGARHEISPVSINSLLQNPMAESWQPLSPSKSFSIKHTGQSTEIDDRSKIIMSYAPGGIFVHRPFLDLTKAQLVAACKSRKTEFVTDKTNEDSKFTVRNAVRALRTHQLPRALQADAIIQLTKKSRRVFRLLQLQIVAYMSNVKISSFNFRSGSAYIQLPRSFIPLAVQQPHIAAGVLSQLCQLVSPNPAESFQTMVEPDRLGEFVRHLQSIFWVDPSKTKAPVFINSRVVFEGYAPPERDESNSFFWKLSRQPLRPAEVKPVKIVLDASTSTEPGRLFSSHKILWDNRFWIQITTSVGHLFNDLTVRAFQVGDWQDLAEQLPRRYVKTLREVMSDCAPGNSRYTLPALCLHDTVVALPTLTDDVLTTKSLKVWLKERSHDSSFSLEWDVEYKVLPTSILYRS